jgi:hypothetical protein
MPEDKRVFFYGLIYHRSLDPQLEEARQVAAWIDEKVISISLVCQASTHRTLKTSPGGELVRSFHPSRISFLPGWVSGFYTNILTSMKGVLRAIH